ncbi:XkdX family protein [Peribacillus frigoritolerans]
MNFWRIAFEYEWATKDQLKLAVEYNDLTVTEYQEITGEPL